MIKAATLSLTLVIGRAPAIVRAQSVNQDAINEAIPRQADRITLRQTLVDAGTAWRRGELVNAPKLYDPCWDLGVKIGTGVDAEARETRAGLAAVRLELAREYQKHNRLLDAKTQVDDVLRVDPQNPAALELKRGNDKLIAENRGKMASVDVQAEIPQIIDQKIVTGTHVQNGKLLFEMGKLEEAKAEFELARRADPLNQAAFYYLNLIEEDRVSEALSRR